MTHVITPTIDGHPLEVYCSNIADEVYGNNGVQCGYNALAYVLNFELDVPVQRDDLELAAISAGLTDGTGQMTEEAVAYFIKHYFPDDIAVIIVTLDTRGVEISAVLGNKSSGAPNYVILVNHYNTHWNIGKLSDEAVIAHFHRSHLPAKIYRALQTMLYYGAQHVQR